MRKWIVGFAMVVFAFTATAQTDSILLMARKMVPDPQQTLTTKLVSDALQQMHYTRPQINKGFADHAYNLYIKQMDYGRMYFLKSDIESFETYVPALADSLKAGNPYFGFRVFVVYLNRLSERMAFVKSMLKDTLTFIKPETVTLDRENAAWFNTVQEQNEYWRKRITYEGLSLKLAGKSGTEIQETLLKRYDNFIKGTLKTKAEDVFSIYINAWTGVADPHTDYMSPRNAEDFKINMSQSLEGIGAVLQLEGDYTKIRELMKGGPADRSKLLHEGDKIVAVGQGKEDKEFTDVVGWRIDDVVALIRGKKDTWVRLQVIPNGAPASEPAKVIAIQRDKVKLEEQTAKSHIDTVKQGKKNYKIGVINLPIFYSNFNGARPGDKDYASTTEDIKKILIDFQNAKVDAVVMDLRNNSGGSLQEAINLTGLFISSGPTVQVKYAEGYIQPENDNDTRIQYNGPLAVLVNRGSASASEIFASAIQDYGRGIILGDRTFGKGTVQNIYDFNRMIKTDQPVGQIKITRAKFYRISGGSTQHRGVVPDIAFPTTIDTSAYGESAEDYPLVYDEIPKAEYKTFANLSDAILQLQRNHDERMKTSLDFKQLNDQVAWLNTERARKSFPIDLTTAQTEQKQREDRELSRLNERRKAANLPPLGPKDEKPKEPANDFILKESEQILIDFMKLIS